MSYKRITSKAELQALARELKVRPDWHEPDEQEVDADVHGCHLDNAGSWGAETLGQRPYQEYWIEIIQDETPAAEVNLADLLAFACQGIDQDKLAVAIVRSGICECRGESANVLASRLISELERTETS